MAVKRASSSCEKNTQAISIAIILAACICVPYWIISTYSSPEKHYLQVKNVYINMPHESPENNAGLIQKMIHIDNSVATSKGYIAKLNDDVLSNFCSKNYSGKKGGNVLSYTLYGGWAKNPHWIGMMHKIAEEARNSTIYRDWTLRLYHNGDIPKIRRKQLEERNKNLQLCDVNYIPHYGNLSHLSSMEWRLLSFGDKTLDMACSRDIDSPLWQREFDAMAQWIKSGKAFHCFRDHPQHGGWRVLGGMFCFRISINRTFSNQFFRAIWDNFNIKNGTREPKKESDQHIIRKYVWPVVKNDAMEHDSYSCDRYPGSIPYPSKRLTNTSGFMGCKRPCVRELPPCPLKCRPKNHQDWTYC